MHRSPKQRRRLQRCAQMLALASSSLTTMETSQAAPLNPFAFSTLGTLNVTSGSLTINTDTLAITGAATFNGVTANQISGPQMAVFNFTSFNIDAGVTINVTGSRPLALLSRNSMSIASAITLNGGNAGVPAAGAAGSAGGFAGGDGGNNGNGPGAGGSTGSNGGGGGGGFGGNGHPGGGIAGVSYGNLMSALQGGSGAAGGIWFGPGGGGGGGAGAIELGAGGTLTLTSVISNGGNGGDTFGGAGGGGSGGGILLHAEDYALTTLQAFGGNSPGFAGAGGGGRIAMAGGTLTAAQINSMLSSVNGGGNGLGQNGIAGVVTFQPFLALVEATQSLDVGITPGQTGQTDARIETLPGALTIESGGLATLVSPVAWGNGSVVTLSDDAALNIANDTTFLTGSTLNWSGGTMIFSAGKTLDVAGGIATVAGAIGAPDGATLRITNGGSFDVSSYFDIGNSDTGGATGTMVVDGSTSRFTSVSTYTDWGRNFGDAATVTLDHGGAATFSAGLVIAGNGGTALVNLLNGGQLNTTSLSVGGGDSNAVINIDGGALNSMGDAELDYGAVINLSNGSLNLSQTTFINTGATLNWTDGALNIGGGSTLIINGGSLISTAPSGLSLNGNTLRVNADGLYQTDRYLDIGTTGTGTLLVFGENARVSSAELSYWGEGGGNNAIVRFGDGGVGTFSGGLEIGRNGASASVEAQEGGSIYAQSLQLGSPGASGQAFLNIIGAVRVTNNAQLGARAFVLYQSGTFEVGGTLAMSDNAAINATPGGDKVVRVGGLSMSGTSTIDLNDNEMIIDYTGPIGSLLSNVRGYIGAGRLVSGDADAAHRLGYANNGDVVRIIQAYAGDANLDGNVNIADLYALAQHFGAANQFWIGGDFDYNGLVNAADLGLLAGNWQESALGGPMLEPLLASLGLPSVNVPEPTSVLGISLFGLMFIRRRRV